MTRFPRTFTNTLPPELTTTEPVTLSIGDLAPGERSIAEWDVTAIGHGLSEFTLVVEDGTATPLDSLTDVVQVVQSIPEIVALGPDPTSITFGTPWPGMPDSPYVRPVYPDLWRSFLIRNTGDGPLTVTGIAIAVPNVFVPDWPTESFVVPPGTEHTFGVEYRPSAAGQFFALEHGLTVITSSGNVGIELSGISTFDSDLNLDGEVGLRDIPILSALYRSKAGDGRYDPKGDPNGDGRVNLLDLPLFSSEYRMSILLPVPAFVPAIGTPTLSSVAVVSLIEHSISRSIQLSNGRTEKSVHAATKSSQNQWRTPIQGRLDHHYAAVSAERIRDDLFAAEEEESLWSEVADWTEHLGEASADSVLRQTFGR